MWAHTLIFLSAISCVLAVSAGVLIYIDRERADKQMREEFKNVFKLQEELTCRKQSRQMKRGR